MPFNILESATKLGGYPTRTFRRCAEGAIWLSKPPMVAYTLCMATNPELTIVRDVNDYPATARCSVCGSEMKLLQRWISSSTENFA